MPDVRFLKYHAEQKRIYDDPAKRKVIRAGRRFGKTTMLEQAAGNWGARKMRVGWFAPSYKVLLPTYKAIKQQLAPIIAHSSKTDGIIELVTGGHVEFWTLDNEDAGRSRKYHKVIVDEASLVKKGLRETWEQAIEPTLLDFDGDAIFAGTPKGIDDENFFYQICTDKTLGFKEFHAPTRNNPSINPEALARIIEGKPPLVVQQEYNADFVDWRGTNFFKLPWLLGEDMRPVPMPQFSSSVFGVMDCAAKGGIANDGSAIVWFAFEQLPTPHLVILDWEIQQIDGLYLINQVPLYLDRTEHLAKICGARFGSSGVHIEDKSTGTLLLQKGAEQRWNTHTIDSVLTSLGKEERAINISGHVASGKVKISEYAYNKVCEYKGTTKNHFLTQVLQFIIGGEDQADDLFDCFNYGIALALGNSDGL